MLSNSVCKYACDKQIRLLLYGCVIMDGIGLHSILLPLLIWKIQIPVLSSHAQLQFTSKVLIYCRPKSLWRYMIVNIWKLCMWTVIYVKKWIWKQSPRKWTQLSSSEHKAWKKFRPVQELNPWPFFFFFLMAQYLSRQCSKECT